MEYNIDGHRAMFIFIEVSTGSLMNKFIETFVSKKSQDQMLHNNLMRPTAYSYKSKICPSPIKNTCLKAKCDSEGYYEK